MDCNKSIEFTTDSIDKLEPYIRKGLSEGVMSFWLLRTSMETAFANIDVKFKGICTYVSAVSSPKRSDCTTSGSGGEAV